MGLVGCFSFTFVVMHRSMSRLDYRSLRCFLAFAFDVFLPLYNFDFTEIIVRIMLRV